MCSSCKKKWFGRSENEINKQQVQTIENDSAEPVRPEIADVEVPAELAVSFGQRDEMLSKFEKQKETHDSTIQLLNETNKTLENDFKNERPQ